MQLLLGQLNERTEVLMVLSIILFAEFIMIRLTDTLNLPEVNGYTLAGVLVGSCYLDFIPVSIITHVGFVNDLASASITSGAGKFFKRKVLLRTGKRILMIILFEALSAGVMVVLFLRFIFSLDRDFALVLGAIATATAPASTIMTINQYKAKREFVDTLLQIVALDDTVCLLAFSVIPAIASDRAPNGVSMEDITILLVFNLLAILLGFFCGYPLSRLLVSGGSRNSRLILAITMLLGISGICAAVNISSPLPCMMSGAAYINPTESKKLFRRINNLASPITSISFIVSGMNLDVYALSTIGVIGFSYLTVHIIERCTDTYISCLITNTSIEIRNFVGLALIPRAGVAIDLVFPGQRLPPPETRSLMLTIILSPSVLYEMIGSVNVRLALIFSGSIPPGKLLEALSQEGETDESFGAVTVFGLIPALELFQRDGESSAQIVKELSVGIDGRDDDDIESAALLEEQRGKKKKPKKKHKKKRGKIVEVPLEENVWAEECE